MRNERAEAVPALKMLAVGRSAEKLNLVRKSEKLIISAVKEPWRAGCCLTAGCKESTIEARTGAVHLQ